MLKYNTCNTWACSKLLFFFFFFRFIDLFLTLNFPLIPYQSNFRVWNGERKKCIDDFIKLDRIGYRCTYQLNCEGIYNIRWYYSLIKSFHSYWHIISTMLIMVFTQKNYLICGFPFNIVSNVVPDTFIEYAHKRRIHTILEILHKKIHSHH